MPELDGVEAARRILAERQVPIVMVTAFAERDIVQQASEAGAFGYLVKPFRQDDVLAAITTAQARSAELADARKEAKSLTEALETRKVVERAKGMLMTAESISEGDAYARMRSASQRTGPAHAGDRRGAAGDALRRQVIRRHAILIAGLALTALAGVLHTVSGDTAGTIAASVPLLLVAPLVAKGTDALRGRLSTSVVGIVQSGFGNVAELAITVLALRANLPDVVKLAIVGSLLGNAVLLGGIAGLLPLIRGGFSATLRFDRRLFSGITTLSVIAFVPMAILSVPSDLLGHGDRQGISLAAGIALTVVGVFFILMELRAPHVPAGTARDASCRPVRSAAASSTSASAESWRRSRPTGSWPASSRRRRRSASRPRSRRSCSSRCSATWPRTTSRCATPGPATATAR